MKCILRKIWMIVIVMTLSACSSMNGSFDCPNKAGMSCKSLDQINSMVDSGQISGRSGLLSSDAKMADSVEFESFPTSAIYHDGAPLRYGETVQRIWLAPYEDTEGNYHQDSLMYSIVKQGHWIGTPLKSVTAR